MKTFTQESQIAQEAVEIIAGQELQISSDKKKFSVAGITVAIEDEQYRVHYKEIEVTLSNIKDLLLFVLVKTTLKDGVYRLHERCLNFYQQSLYDQKHITRICNYNMFGTNKVDLYNRIAYSDNKPSELSEMMGISVRLITNIRKLNRKAIITSVITELMYKQDKDSIAA